MQRIPFKKSSQTIVKLFLTSNICILVIKGYFFFFHSKISRHELGVVKILFTPAAENCFLITQQVFSWGNKGIAFEFRAMILTSIGYLVYCIQPENFLPIRYVLPPHGHWLARFRRCHPDLL